MLMLFEEDVSMRISCRRIGVFAAVLMIGVCGRIASAQAAGDAVQVNPAQVFGNMIRTAERDAVGLAEAMPEDKYGFAPSQDLFKAEQGTKFTGVRTFGQQVAHIAASNYEWLQAMGLEKDKDPAAIEKVATKAEALKALKESFAAAEKAAAMITPQNAFEGMGPKKTTTRAGLAGAMAWHTMDHYGQMVVYGRMNGVVPPGSR
jgi:uncharacterized damage-inducible protein DinB